MFQIGLFASHTPYLILVLAYIFIHSTHLYQQNTEPSNSITTDSEGFQFDSMSYPEASIVLNLESDNSLLAEGQTQCVSKPAISVEYLPPTRHGPCLANACKWLPFSRPPPTYMLLS